MGDSMIYDGQFYRHGKGSHSVIFDDDGRVAYAYLLNPEEKIVGDIWLYNRCKTPVEPEWKDREAAPYANPQAYVNEPAHDSFEPVNSIDEVQIDWSDAGGTVTARIYIRDVLIAVVGEGTAPGWSVFASKDGPLAKVLKPQ